MTESLAVTQCVGSLLAFASGNLLRLGPLGRADVGCGTFQFRPAMSAKDIGQDKNGRPYFLFPVQKEGQSREVRKGVINVVAVMRHGLRTDLPERFAPFLRLGPVPTSTRSHRAHLDDDADERRGGKDGRPQS